MRRGTLALCWFWRGAALRGRLGGRQLARRGAMLMRSRTSWDWRLAPKIHLAFALGVKSENTYCIAEFGIPWQPL